MPKYFVSAIQPDRQLGVMQFEASDDVECRRKAESICPERAIFRSFVVAEFDNIPIDQFVDAEELKRLGY